MAKYKVYLTDSIFPDQELEKKALAAIDAEIIYASKKDTETFIREGSDCDAVLVVYAEVERAFIESMSKCKIIVRTGIGYNNIDVNAASERGIFVANIPDYCFGEVADHAMALLLSCLRKIVPYNNQVRSGVWNMNNGRPIPRIASLVFGSYGFGNIAQATCARAKAFEMDVVAFDPYIPDSVFEKSGVRRATDWESFLREIDVLSVHAPLTDETRGVINKDVFKHMKKTSCLINTARGPLVNEDDLYDALVSGEIAMAGLDVLIKEPPNPDLKLLQLENAIVTPHASFYSDEAEIELREKAVNQIILTLTEGAPKYCVNKKQLGV
ncbi:MAG: C-terminal binding protein [Defluviitaleaceae bacterium]|nr:C-terminal binding protein [Defluviitaleaceae bacterium]